MQKSGDRYVVAPTLPHLTLHSQQIPANPVAGQTGHYNIPHELNRALVYSDTSVGKAVKSVRKVALATAGDNSFESLGPAPTSP